MISLTYLKLVITGKKYIDKEQWETALNERIVPALRDIDMDNDGRITAAELLRAAIRVITSYIA